MILSDIVTLGFDMTSVGDIQLGVHEPDFKYIYDEDEKQLRKRMKDFIKDSAKKEFGVNDRIRICEMSAFPRRYLY